MDHSAPVPEQDPKTPPETSSLSMLDKRNPSKSTHPDKTHDVQPSDVPVGLKLYLITLSLMLSVFCVALDNTVSTQYADRITRDADC